MSKIKYSFDQPFTKWWATRIGQVIMNFSALEFETYKWLSQLSKDPQRIQEWSKMFFCARAKEVIKHIYTCFFPQDWKSKSITTWNEIIDLALKRNRIAHNPLLFGRSDGKECGESDFIGIVDIKNPNKVEPFLNKDEISTIVHKIADQAVSLSSLYKELCDFIDSEN